MAQHWRRVLYPHSPFGLVARVSATNKRGSAAHSVKTAAHVHPTLIRGGLLGLGDPWAASCLGRDPSGSPAPRSREKCPSMRAHNPTYTHTNTHTDRQDKEIERWTHTSIHTRKYIHTYTETSVERIERIAFARSLMRMASHSCCVRVNSALVCCANAHIAPNASSALSISRPSVAVGHY